ncbi:MAG: hypothetical protein IT176_04015 [Acidobacteria bacterium]|nr:hypothetical protein [Acidobacteriota bacterium]
MRFVLSVLTIVGLGFAAAGASSPAAAPPQAPASGAAEAVPTQPMPLATVRIPRAVKANDQLLPPGTYQVRLAGRLLPPVPGETPDLEQWVEFLQRGQVKGRAAAPIVPGNEIQSLAKGPIPSSGSARVELLKEGDYVRVWINKGGMNYLIYLPTA